jgi:hypothetical protein
MVNGIAWLLLLPAIAALTAGGVQVATAQEKITFFISVVAVLGGGALINALFSLALARGLALREGPGPMRLVLIGGFVQFAAVVSGALAFGRMDTWEGDPSIGTILGLILTWLVYGTGHLLQAIASRRLAPVASVVHAVFGFVGLVAVPLLGFQIDFDHEPGVGGIMLSVAQAVLGLTFPFVIGIVWLRYAAGLRKPRLP